MDWCIYVFKSYFWKYSDDIKHSCFPHKIRSRYCEKKSINQSKAVLQVNMFVLIGQCAITKSNLNSQSNDFAKICSGYEVTCVKFVTWISLSCYMDLSKLIFGFLWVITWICQNWFMEFSKLFHGFVKIDTCISLSCYMDLSRFKNGFLWVFACMDLSKLLNGFL